MCVVGEEREREGGRGRGREREKEEEEGERGREREGVAICALSQTTYEKKRKNKCSRDFLYFIKPDLTELIENEKKKDSLFYVMHMNSSNKYPIHFTSFQPVRPSIHPISFSILH